MKYFVLCLSCLLFFVSCKEEKPPMPADKMANILADLHMAVTFAQLVPKDRGDFMENNKDTLAILNAHIYQKYDIDTTSFNEALLWYKQRPKVFDKVYETVLNTLSIRKDSYTDSISEYTDTTEVEIKDTL